jgi:hypothetical protein
MAGRRAAEWRLPTEKQRRTDELRKALLNRTQSAPTDEDAWWDSVLSDPRARPTTPIADRELGQITEEVL